jgi:hypothetical protein
VEFRAEKIGDPVIVTLTVLVENDCAPLLKEPLNRAGCAAFLAEHGDLEEARTQASELAKIAPKMTFDDLVASFARLCKQGEHRPKRLLAGLRKAMAMVNVGP